MKVKSMSTIANKLMTAEDFYDWANRPKHQDKIFELESGHPVEVPFEGKRHGFVCANVTALLGNHAARKKKGYVCCNGTGIIVSRNPDTVRGCDVLFFEDATSANQIDWHYADTPPRLAIEVLSANDNPGKITCRVQEQICFGTPLIWVVEPESESVTVYRPGNDNYMVGRKEEITGEDILPGFHCKVAEFFALPGQ
jgi:Uma2 family endonuclease